MQAIEYNVELHGSIHTQSKEAIDGCHRIMLSGCLVPVDVDLPCILIPSWAGHGAFVSASLSKTLEGTPTKPILRLLSKFTAIP